MKRKSDKEDEQVQVNATEEVIEGDGNEVTEELKSKKPRISSSVRNKRKARKSKGMPSMPQPPSPKGRDFVSDLKSYLRAWKARDEDRSTWKFNKVLQVWAIANCLYQSKVDEVLFKRLIPYLETVRGSARDRMIEMLKNAVVGKTEVDEKEGAGEGGGEEEAEALTDEQLHAKRELAIQRAKKLLSRLKS